MIVLVYAPRACAAAGVTVPPRKTLIVVLLTMLNVCAAFGLKVTGMLVGPLPSAMASVSRS